MVCLNEDVYNMSSFCLRDGFNSSLCRPDIQPSGLRQAAGFWCILNAIVGFSGNLLTLLAIPYASKHKRLVKYTRLIDLFCNLTKNTTLLYSKLLNKQESPKLP